MLLFSALFAISTAALAQDPSSQPIQTNRESAKIVIIVDRVEFSRGSSTIPKEDYIVLDAVADTLNSRPDILVLEIQGHADPTTEGLYAEKISLKRANAVKKYLVSQGVDPERLLAVGYAAKLPRTTGKTAQERAKNRRIELNVAQKSQ
jgi:OOP family OmpA-OmpF porin